MKFKLTHAPYIGNKIATDLASCEFVELLSGIEPVAKIAAEIIKNDIEAEFALDEKARDLLDENLEKIEFMQADERHMFWKIKQKLAQDSGFILPFEDRYNNLSHLILNALFDNDLLDSEVSQTRIINVIFKAFDSYSKLYADIDEIVHERISNYKRKIIFGSEEYDLIFEKLYREELAKKGLA